MKRTRLERHTPMKRSKKEMKRAQLARHTRMKFRSDKRQAHIDATRKADEQWRKNHTECAFCYFKSGKRREAHHKHHIVPRSKAGPNWDLEVNWSAACTTCHDEMDDPRLWSYAEQLAAVWLWEQEGGGHPDFTTLSDFLTAWKEVDAQQTKGVTLADVLGFLGGRAVA